MENQAHEHRFLDYNEPNEDRLKCPCGEYGPRKGTKAAAETTDQQDDAAQAKNRDNMERSGAADGAHTQTSEETAPKDKTGGQKVNTPAGK